MPDIHKRRISNHRVYFDYQARFRPIDVFSDAPLIDNRLVAHGASDVSRRVRGDLHEPG